MEASEIHRFLLAGALDYLNQLSPERRNVSDLAIYKA
jgi:hypothetical protein